MTTDESDTTQPAATAADVPYCATHRPKTTMGYIAYAEWMMRQRGQTRRCPTCRRWMYRGEYGPGWQHGEREHTSPADRYDDMDNDGMLP